MRIAASLLRHIQGLVEDLHGIGYVQLILVHEWPAETDGCWPLKKRVEYFIRFIYFINISTSQSELLTI